MPTWKVIVAAESHTGDRKNGSVLGTFRRYAAAAFTFERESAAYGPYGDVVWIDGPTNRERRQHAAWDRTGRCGIRFMTAGRCVHDKGHEGRCLPVAHWRH